ncbi:hypothetical protein [Syntrophomonas curvata]
MKGKEKKGNHVDRLKFEVAQECGIAAPDKSKDGKKKFKKS